MFHLDYYRPRWLVVPEGSGATSELLPVAGDTDPVEICGSTGGMSVYEKNFDVCTAGILVRRLHNVSFGLNHPALLHAPRRFDREDVRCINLSSSLICDKNYTLPLYAY